MHIHDWVVLPFVFVGHLKEIEGVVFGGSYLGGTESQTVLAPRDNSVEVKPTFSMSTLAQ